MFRTLLSASALAAGLALSPAAQAETWTVDASHSQVGFKIRHMMVSWVRGSFGEFDGTVETDGVTLKSIDGTVGLVSIDTANGKRDDHLRSGDFFDTEAFPKATFKSTDVAKKGDGYAVTGDLTIHGVTRPVTFTVDALPAARKDPWGNTKTGTSMTTTLNRQDFGLTWNKALDEGGYVVGDEVEVTIDLELNQKS